MSSETPEIEPEPPPPPAPPDEDESFAPPPSEAEHEMEWPEDYEEHIEAEERPRRPKKKRRYGGVIALVVVLIILLAWTLMSPEVMPAQGTTYIQSDRYANLGNYTGSRDIWAGKMVWGVSLSGDSSASAGEEFDIMVLVTKVSEERGNFFLRGTSIELTNVSVFETDGTFVAKMTDTVEHGFGESANVTLSFAAAGNYSLYVYVKFTVYEAMLVGFLPLEVVEVEKVYVDDDIVVTATP